MFYVPFFLIFSFEYRKCSYSSGRYALAICKKHIWCTFCSGTCSAYGKYFCLAKYTFSLSHIKFSFNVLFCFVYFVFVCYLKLLLLLDFVGCCCCWWCCWTIKQNKKQHKYIAHLSNRYCRFFCFYLFLFFGGDKPTRGDVIFILTIYCECVKYEKRTNRRQNNMKNAPTIRNDETHNFEME